MIIHQTHAAVNAADAGEPRELRCALCHLSKAFQENHALLQQPCSCAPPAAGRYISPLKSEVISRYNPAAAVSERVRVHIWPNHGQCLPHVCRECWREQNWPALSNKPLIRPEDDGVTE